MPGIPLPVEFLIPFVFGVHIALVNLDIGLSTAIPLMKWTGEKKGDGFLVERSKTLMRYYAGTYAIAGVFGTAFTVALLSFYPQFIGLAGHLTWVPFGLAIMAIALRFLSIVGYWYLWDKISSGLHAAIGAAMALTGFLVPLGFRAVFAFLNSPEGLHLEPKPYLDVAEALANPSFAPLYLKSVVGGLAVGALVLASAYAWRLTEVEGEARRRYAELASTAAKYGAIAVVIMVPLGVWYLAGLWWTTPFKFANVIGSLMGMAAQSDYSWLFILKMALVAVQLAAAAYLLRRPLLAGGAVDPSALRWAKVAGPAALATVVSGELLNMFSQLPYFVARPDLAAALPEPIVQAISAENVNSLANLPELYWITAAMLVPLLAAVAALFYFMVKGEGEGG